MQCQLLLSQPFSTLTNWLGACKLSLVAKCYEQSLAIFFVFGHAQGAICFSRKTNSDLKLLTFTMTYGP